MEQPIRGLIFSEQGYSIQDGPGMRTTVFMKGCPLSCRWCHNPESVKPYPELMYHERTCIACGDCIKVCPLNAITLKEPGIAIDREKCDRCFKCASACPTGSLDKVGTMSTVEEVMAEIDKDEMFYRRSGGGVTVSGGEPLLQADFVREIFKECKKRHLRTALDTSGYASWEKFESVLEYTDLVLFDIKHIHPEIHKKGTGVDNRLILENLRKIPRRVKIWLRVPLIADYNDSPDTFRKIVELGLEVGAEKVSLLPYHEWGVGKYNAIGREYPFYEAKPVPEERIQQLKGIADELGLPCTVGY